MKKSQYIVAMVCILMGAAGFAGIYAMEQSQKDKNDISKQSESEEIPGKGIDLVDIGDIPKNDQDLSDEDSEETEEPDLTEVADHKTTPEVPQTPVAEPQEEILHFSKEGLTWPIEGTVLLDYSMDATIYFPTLNQYQYNPAMVISGAVNSKVYFVSKGKITDVSTNEETGCTVTQDLGDGYTAVYGQLKEINNKVGDTVEAGQVVGYVSEPTKYYSLEGANVYFKLLKDGVPVDPETVLPK
jgi:murein DD-endopeptidase MepM/ murein hydrolase activator NlpD